MINFAIPSGSKLCFFNRSEYSPPPKYLSGSDIDNCLVAFCNAELDSETALLNPPIIQCSSTVTINLLFSEYLFIVFLSIGLIVCILITLASKLFFFKISAALREL